MDPLSVVGATVALVQQTFQITNLLKHAMVGRSFTMQNLQEEVERLNEVIKDTQQRISNGDLIPNVALMQTLSDCSTALQRTEKLVTQSTSTQKRKIFLTLSTKDNLQRLCQDLERLRYDLVLHKLTSQRSTLSTDAQELQNSKVLNSITHMGLRKLYDPVEAHCDIIFLHGLNGHPEKTWQWLDVPHSREVLWPRDFLPRDLPDARVYSYGYKSEISVNMARSSLAEAAELLSATVVRERRDSPVDRPIIWVAHSLGGLLVKAALGHSWRHRDLANPQGSLFNATIGLVFLATPHRSGTNPAWINTLDRINKITKVPHVDSGKSVISMLWQENSIQEQNSAEFSDLISEGRIVVFSFFETEKTSTPWGHTIITDVSSALGHASERVHFLTGNHSTLCKFQDSSELGYRRIVDALYEIRDYAKLSRLTLAKEDFKASVLRIHKLGSNSTVTPEVQSDIPSNEDSIDTYDATRPEQRKDFQRALDVSWMERKVIEPRDLGTCNWILQSGAFLRWREDPQSNLFHVMGENGVGKTVLSNFVVDYLQNEMKGEASSKPAIKPTIVLYFFFELKQRVDLAIYDLIRIFISQLLDIKPLFMRYVPRKQRNRHRRSKSRRWISSTTEDLEDLLNILLCMLRDPECRMTYCVIDGIDECDGVSIPWLLRLLDQLYINDDIKVLLTSGPMMSAASHTKIRTVPGLTPQMEDWLLRRDRPCDLKLNVPLANGFAVDLQSFVKPRLKKLAVSRGLSQEIKDKLEETLLQPHKNGFVWAALVLQIVGTLNSTRQIRDFLVELKVETSDLAMIYQLICYSLNEPVTEAESAPGSFTLRTLAFVSFAMRPLKMEDLAIGITVKNTSQSLEDIIDNKPLGLDRYLESRLGNLIRFQNGAISFINSTFKRFIDDRLLAQDHNLANPSEVHFQMASACLTFLDICLYRRQSLTAQGLQVDTATPFLEYASLCWVSHLQAAGDKAPELNTLLKKLWSFGSVECRQRVFLDFLKHGKETSDRDNPLLCVLAELDLPQNLLLLPEYIDLSPERRTKFLLHVRDCSSEATWQQLVEHGTSNVESPEMPLTYAASDINFSRLMAAVKSSGDVSKLKSLLRQSPDLQPQERQTLLSGAVRWHRTAMVEFLIRSSKVQLNDPQQHHAVLEEAVNVQRVDLVTLLLDHYKPKSFGKCLHIAAQNPSTEIVMLLLGRGADCNAEDDTTKQTALHVAAKTGQIHTVKLLIDWRAEPSAEDRKGRRPIHRAAERGYNDIVEFLFRIVPHFGQSDLQGRTPFFAACEGGQLETARELLRYGSNIWESDKSKRTALHAAVAKGVEDIVQLLLANGSDPNAKDNNGRTPLHEAAIHGSDAIIEVLILAGADVNSKDSEGKAPLHHACTSNKWRGSSETLITMLLEANADPLLQDCHGRIALHYAAGTCNAAISTQLSSVPETVSMQDEDGNSPLHFATRQPESCFKSVIRALVVSGGDPDLPNKQGKTPVDLAIAAGNTDWVEEISEWQEESNKVSSQFLSMRP